MTDVLKYHPLLLGGCDGATAGSDPTQHSRRVSKQNQDGGFSFQELLHRSWHQEEGMHGVITVQNNVMAQQWVLRISEHNIRGLACFYVSSVKDQ